MEYDLAPPEPAGLVASLSSLGYSLSDAIADLVDNAVSASSQVTHVEFTWDGSESWIAVIDDGQGMSEDSLVTAMTVAARWSATDRSSVDLGRFGMGLKSASFSQCRLLTVSSAEADGVWKTRTWDLELVEKTGQWRLLRTCSENTKTILNKLRKNHTHGTIVLWQKITAYRGVLVGDQKAQRQFYDERDQVAEHLGLVFSRFLTGQANFKLHVGGQPVKAWDPFLTSNPSVRREPVERLLLDGHTIKVEPFILPSLKKLDKAQAEQASGPKGWLQQQGFYIYRRNRLILAGSWLGIRGLRREEKYNMARISVDIPAETDAKWQVDVRKATVVPPVVLRRHLERIARHARKTAAETVRNPGQVAARQHSEHLIFSWNVRRDEGVISCRINRSHPLVRAVLQEGKTESANIRALLSLLEETLPIPALRVLHEVDTADDPEPFGGLAEESQEAREVAQRMFEVLLSQGRSPEESRKLIRTMQPFDQISGFWNT